MDVRKKDLEFYVLDWICLKISPIKNLMRFCKEGKLSPHFVGPYKILRCAGNVTYDLHLLSELASVHPVIHVSVFKSVLNISYQ